MIVCVRHRVSDRDIAQAVRAGCARETCDRPQVQTRCSMTAGWVYVDVARVRDRASPMAEAA